MKKFLVVALFIVACGDNLSATTDAHVSIDSPSSIDAAPAIPKAIAVAGDFAAPPGVISSLDLGTLAVHQNLVAAVVTDDPQVRKIGSKLYIVNRDTNNITVLDASTYNLIGQLATGAASNPQDVAVVGDKLYLPALGTKGVVVGTLGQASPTVVDLSGADGVNDPDGKPDCVGAYAVGTDVYVVCEDLDSTFTPRGMGVLVVIDSATDMIRTKLALPVANPQGFIKALGSDLLVTTYDSPAGCTIKITPGPTPTATCMTQNADLGGTPIAFDVSGTKVWFAYSASDFSHSWARAYDTTTSLYEANLTPDAQTIHDVAACPNGKIVVADATLNAAGLRVFSGTTETTTAALSVGIPPAYGNGLVCY